MNPVIPTNGDASNATSSGPDTILLHLQEDAYQGDAQYIVAVDGAQIGGVRVTLQLKAILALSASVTAVNNDIRPASNIKYAAIPKLRSAHLLPAKGCKGGSISRTEIVVALHHAGPNLDPRSQGENITSSAVIQVGYQL